MSDGNMTWIIAIVALLAGAVIGALIYRMTSGGASENRRLKQRVAETELEVRQLRDGVNRHFGDVRELADALAQQSEALRARLDEDAETLGSPSPQRRLSSRSDASTSGDKAPTTSTASSSTPTATTPSSSTPAAATTPDDQAQHEIDTLHVPRDYADGNGTLDESYGLKEKKKASEEPTQPPRY